MRIGTAAMVFVAMYVLNMLYITVFYHRGLAHGAVRMKPWLRWVVAHTGNWVTGLDPKGWSCMHRLHHQHSDTAEDPHSPKNGGLLNVFGAQLRSYQRVLIGLMRCERKYTVVVRDLDFRVSAQRIERALANDQAPVAPVRHVVRGPIRMLQEHVEGTRVGLEQVGIDVGLRRACNPH